MKNQASGIRFAIRTGSYLFSLFLVTLSATQARAYANPLDCDRSSFQQISKLSRDTASALNRTLPQTSGKRPALARTAAIYGNSDPRFDVTGAELMVYPFSAIGAVNRCTSFRVSECHVMLASHCVYDENGNQKAGTDVFSSSKLIDDRRTPGTPLPSRRDNVAKWSEFNGNWREDPAKDWVIGLLDNSSGNETGYFGLLGVHPDGVVGNTTGFKPEASQSYQCDSPTDWQVSGYSVDRTRGNDHAPPLSNDPTAEIVRFEDGHKILKHRAATMKGASGGPIWTCQADGTAQVLAINSQASMREDRSQITLPANEQVHLAMGVPISAIFDELKNFMRENPCGSHLRSPGLRESARPRPRPRRSTLQN